MWKSLFFWIASIAIVRGETGKSKFLLSAPNTFTAGKTEKLWLNVFENRNNSDFTIRLVEENSGKELHSVTLNNTGEQLLELDFIVPNTDEIGAAKLQVIYDGNETLSTNVRIKSHSTIVLIETDRPFYKPGELVRFRLLHLDQRLLPVSHSIKRIWIESASNVKMAQWRNVHVKNGMTQLEMQLSKEPVQGTWKIKVQTTNASAAVQKSFEIKEYVLPKFEVIISPPTYITAGAKQNYTWRVCAKYSFGKPVQGNATVFFKFKQPMYHWYAPRKIGESEYDSIHSSELRKEDGCHEFILHQSMMEDFEKSYPYAIDVKAKVIERGTGETQEGNHHSDIHRQSKSLDFKESPKHYYPHLPYFGTVHLKYQNGMPVANVNVEITIDSDKPLEIPIEEKKQIIASDSSGMVYFTIAPLQHNASLTIHAKTLGEKAEDSISGNHIIIPWFSPSDSYILIKSPTEVACGEKTSMEIYYTYNKSESASSIRFYYTLQARGEIISKGSKPVEPTEHTIAEDFTKDAFLKSQFSNTKPDVATGKWNFELTIEPAQSPEMQLVMYHVKNGAEIVASNIKLKVKSCLKHEVKSKFIEKNAQPGEKVTLSLSTSSKSLCAISGVDKAVTFLDRERAINVERVFERLKSYAASPDYNVYGDYTVEDCTRNGHGGYPHHGPRRWLPKPVALRMERMAPRTKRWYMYNPMREFGNSKRAFAEGSMVLLSSLDHNLKPCHDGVFKENCNACPEVPNVYEDMYDSDSSGVMLMMRAGQIGNPIPLNAMVPEMSQARSYASVVPIAAMEKSYEVEQAEPAVEMRTDFPETWLWQLEEVSDKKEKLLELQTPHSITDWVLNTMCISNKEGLGIAPETSIRVIKPYFMDFTLPYSVKRGEILPLKVTLFNYLNEAMPIKLNFGHFTGGDLKSEGTYSACLQGRDSLVHTFKLDAKVLGDHNISVTAGLDFNSTCGPEILMNMRDGVTKSIKIKPEGYTVEITNSMFLCLTGEDNSATMTWHLPVPENAVPDSARGEIAVIGDVMGPSMENLDNLVQLPMGCGEQNMVLFVPNIVVLNYLNTTDSTNPTLKAKAIANMAKGYQRELTYRHDDGSYSAFGKSDPSGSMWLTAFVVKSFAQAKKFVFIDDKDLDASVKWIQGKQLENGCFPQKGKVFHKEMKGGISGSTSAITSLSAYVLISLLESKRTLKEKLVENAIYCLTKSNGEEPDLYSTILTAYALQLVNERISTTMVKSAADEYLEKVVQKATTNNETDIFWQKEGSPNLGLDIEMTAYAILTLVKAGEEEHLMQALSAVKWISKQRNSNGGFVSTQDTVVALEALAKYASAIPANKVKMELKATTDDENGAIIDFHINEENRQILQQREIPYVPTYVHWAANGEGCSLLQSTLRYNLPQSANKENAFTLETYATNVVPGLCNELLLQFDVKYNLQDESSNMAVLEIELLSGYEPEKSTLDDLKLNKKLNIKRWDFDDGKVSLYFDSIKKGKKLHFAFVISQKIIVENIKPAQMKLYDYYEHESFVRTEYGLENLICSWEMLPAPSVVVLEAGNPSATKLFALTESPTTEKSSNEELAADAPDFNSGNVINDDDDRFKDFRDVDHDLVFPDGMEGPVPVIVPPPRNHN